MEIRNTTSRIITSSLVITGILLFSQTPTTTPITTPTLAPTKTATSTPTTPRTNISTPIPDAKPRVRTQADLNILTGNIQRPNGIAWIDEKLYISCAGDWTLYEVNPSNNSTSQYIYGVQNAHTIHTETNNEQIELWIPDFQNNTLIHIYQGRSEIITSDLQRPWGITKIDEETFLVTNLSNNKTVSIKTTGEVKELINNLKSPTGITSDEDNIYIANTGSTRRSIEWYPKIELLERDLPLNSETTGAEPLISGLQNTTNITIGPDGLLYFNYALGTRGVVGRINPDVCITNGGCTSQEVEIVVYTELAAPLAGLAITPDMRVYLHSIYSPDIYWVDLANEEATE